MPYVVMGIHFLVALSCAVHVVRTRQPSFWLFVLFSFPVLGSLVYMLAVGLPHARLQRGASRAVRAARRSLDPMHEVRAAQAEFDFLPTAEHERRLAKALLAAGQVADSVRHFEALRGGPLATDPELQWECAQAQFEAGAFAAVASALDDLAQRRPAFRVDEVLLLRARALAGAEQHAAAQEAFEEALRRYGTFEVHAEYAMWALSRGDEATAARLQAGMDRLTQRWSRIQRELNAEPMQRLRSAQALAQSKRAAGAASPPAR